MSNALQNKGHANRRPAVCKKSLPTKCPIGKISFRTRGFSYEGGASWFVDATWEIEGVPLLRFGTAIASVRPGEDPGPIQVTLFLPFEYECHPVVPGGKATIAVKVTDDDDCDYIGTATVIVPLEPVP